MPSFILTLGNTAGRAIFAYQSGIGQVHGHVFRSGSIRGVPTYHPAAALRGGPSVVEVMRDDLRVVRRLSRGVVSWRRHTTSAEETQRAGEEFAALLRPGDIVL